MALDIPSNKWLAAQVTAVGALVIALIQNGWQLSPELQVLLVGTVVQAIVTYLVPNTPMVRRRDLTPARAVLSDGVE